MKTTQTLDIGEVAQASGIAPSALRYYEQKGLIRSIGRQGLRRVFNKTVLDQLAFITLGQRAGFTLNEIKNMVHADGNFEIDRTLLLERANAIDSKIKELSKVRDGLRRTAACTAPSHAECSTFQRLLNVAGKI